MSMLATTVLADLDHETASTRSMLQRIPAAHLDFAPHEKNWTLRDERLAGFKAALAAASDADLQVKWTATVGEQVVMSMPRIAVLRGMVLNHMIHHRAPLSICCRLLDVPLPGLYGPSADER